MAACFPFALAAADSAPAAESQDRSAPVAAAGLSRAVYEQRVAEYRANPAAHASHAGIIAYADALLHLGDHTGALIELFQAEGQYPDSYLTALHLGMANELVGNLARARHWIVEALHRNPDARNGSEWLHLAIIDARLALAGDPTWLERCSILQRNTHRTAEEILSAIEIQLALRAEYGIPADLIDCDLNFEAGVCAFGRDAQKTFFARSLALGDLRRTQIEYHAQMPACALVSVSL